MIEYVTMAQIEDAIEYCYHKSHVVMSFYDTLIYLKRHGAVSAQRPDIPEFSAWDLTDLHGLLELFGKIPVPLVVKNGSVAEEHIQKRFYEAATTVFKQPRLLQTLDHPDHARQPSNSVRIIYVLKGSCRMTLGKWSDTLDSESVVLLSSDMNAYLDTGVEDIVLNVFIDKSHFTKSFFTNTCLDDIKKQFFERAIYEAKNGILHFKVLQPDHVHTIYQRLLIEMCQGDDHSEAIIRGYIRLLCTELNRASMIYSDSILDECSDTSNRLMQVFPALLQYIRSHYESVTLNSLSERFHYDSAYLSRMIKKLTGMNFSTILTQTRLDAAEQMLLTGDKKVESIAAQVGYDSYDHFARVFKKKNGVTPYEFLRQHRLTTRK